MDKVSVNKTLIRQDLIIDSSSSLKLLYSPLFTYLSIDLVVYLKGAFGTSLVFKDIFLY